MSFINDLKFMPGRVNEGAVNSEFTLLIDAYFSIQTGMVTIKNNGHLMVDVHNSQSEKRAYEVKKGDNPYALLFTALRGKSGSHKISYVEREGIAYKDVGVYYTEKLIRVELNPN